jgi:hypothetical protein
VDETGRRRAAQVVRAALTVVTLVAAGEVRAQVARDSVAPVHEVFASCAGDGLPPNPHDHAGRRVPYSVQLSALAQAWGVAYAGRDIRQTDLGAADGSGLYLGYGRVGACGQVATGWGPFSWTLVYEPLSLDESGQPDARGWGRMAAAEISLAPFRWLTISAGIRKVAFSYGHDEPLQLRALPIIPYITQSVAPDRRAGITLDDDFGAAHVIIGVYQGRRDLSVSADSGMLLAARLVAEPIGPVGNTVSTLGDPEYWRPRPRFAVNASILYEYAAGASTYALGADGAMHWGPVGLAGEYIYASNTEVEAPTRHTPKPRISRQGLWLETAIMLWRPYVELSARYDWLDNPHLAGQRFHAITTGATLYAFKQLLKVQALYTHKFRYAITPVREVQDDAFLLVGQLALERLF